MSSNIVANPVRIWVQRSQAEIVQVDGRNHARLQNRADLFPLYDCAWKVTVFSVDGQWYRLVTAGEDSPQRQAWKKTHTGHEDTALEQKRLELAALEITLKAREEELLQREKAMHAEIAKLKAEYENRPKSQPLPSPNATSPRKSESSASLTANQGDANAATTNSASKSPRLSFFGARPSYSASSSESSSSSAFGLPSQHRAYSRSGSTAMDTSTSSSSSRPISALPSSMASIPENVSSSLPNTSPIASMCAPTPPGSGRLERPSSGTALTSPRRIHSLPLGAPELQPLHVFGEASSESSDSLLDSSSGVGDGGLGCASHFSPVLSSPSRSRPVSAKGMLSYDLSEDRQWSKERCDEWLKQKLYPSTDPNEKTSSGQRAVHCACLDGQTEVVDFLIARGGVDANQKDLIGNTPLILAASKGKMETVRWLLSHGAQLDAVAPSGRTALHSCAAGGYLDVCQLLVSLGADPLRKEQFGKTPRALAEAYTHSQVSAFLKLAESERSTAK